MYALHALRPALKRKAIELGVVTNMKNTKFVVRVDRGGTHATDYVQRIDRTPIRTTPNRNLALVMGRFTAEDAVKSIQNSRCSPDLVSVRLSALPRSITKISRDARNPFG
jgi:hypothetical protein